MSGICLAISLVMAFGAFVPAVAMADDEPTQEDGLIALRTANDAFDDEDFETAYENYTKAFSILGIPQVKYRMGQTAQKTGKYEEAIEHYEAYREIGDDEEYLGRIEEALPELHANIEQAEAEAVEEVAEIDEETEPEEIEITEREEESDIADEAISEGLQLEVPKESADGGLGVWGWTTAGLGVSMLALGGVMSVLQAGATSQVNDFDRSSAGAGANESELNEMRQDLEGHRSDAETYHQAAMGSYIAGGVLTAAGAGILIFEALRSSDDSESGGMSFQGGLGPDGGFVGLQGRF